MSYIIVLPEGVLTSKERAEAISRELYCITAPEHFQEEYQKDGTVFGIVEHPDGIQTALQISEDFKIYVHGEYDTSGYVSLFQDLTEDQAIDLHESIYGKEFVLFSDIIPATDTVMTQEQMALLGWFPYLDQVD